MFHYYTDNLTAHAPTSCIERFAIIVECEQDGRIAKQSQTRIYLYIYRAVFLIAAVTVVITIKESFRFKDEDENEYEIWLPVFNKNAWKFNNTDD